VSESPKFHTTGHLMSASSSWTGGFFPTDLLTFDFAAVGLRINNSCGDRVFYSLKGAPTTAGDFIAGCSATVLSPIPPTGSLGLLTTSSSCTSRPLVGVSAWASA